MSHLIYIVGASGAGKDALMQYARMNINGSLPVLFAHRYITREAREGSENHIALSPEEFRFRRDKDLFALQWESHGLYYGVGREIDYWMNAGLHVVMNGSRQYLPVANKRYPGLITIVIEADPAVIRHRLETRGRESGLEIETRIQRRPDMPVAASDRIHISNNHSLEEGGDLLVAAIRNLC